MEEPGLNERTNYDFSDSRGLFITNEGNFMYGNASLSYLDLDNNQIYNEVFYKVNGIPLGDVAQSITVRNDLAYIVINNSGGIYVIDINNFKLKGIIRGLTSPRYIHFINDEKAYVSDLYAMEISIVNPKTFKKIGSIDISNGKNQHPSEQMVQYQNFVFTNAWSYDNKILVLDSDTDKLVDSIEVGIQPTSICMDKNNKIWAITDGGYEGSPYGYEEPALYKIDAASRNIEQIIKFEKGDRCAELAMNSTKDTIYFIKNDIWKMSVTNPVFPKEPFIKNKNTKYYGITIDPSSSDLYLADAIDYVQPGILYRYNSNGILDDEYKIGVIPGSFAFVQP
jgi:glutamine cyclotransferase